MPAVTETLETVRALSDSGYKFGFETAIEMDLAPKGLTEDTIRLISARKDEPAWLLDWRLAAFAGWKKMEEPHWARVWHAPIDYQDIHYYAAPRPKSGPKSAGRGRSRTARHLREARHPAEGARHPGRGGRSRFERRGRCRVRQRLGRHHLPRNPGEIRRDFLPDQRGGARTSRARAQIPRQRRAGGG